jgi:uncharacterized repeat protein (TIGR03803 family)
MSKFNWGKRACFVFLLWAAIAVALPPAQTFTPTTLLSFNDTDGNAPQAGLVQATDGDFYGTTETGGANLLGTVFKITPSGVLMTTVTFDRTNGGNPLAAGLVQTINGSFYGTTESGGGGTACPGGGGCGTVFEITPSGKFTKLKRFINTNGANPYAGLIQGTDGDFYGTTETGGANLLGTIFKITPSGMLTTLDSFDKTDGANPYAGLIQGIDGDFYGTTYYGGKNTYYGTVFKITPSGMLTTLHSFNNTDGAHPYAGLVQATDGDFYGTTAGGGANGYYGTIFKITPSGMPTTLYSFCPQGPPCADGTAPYAALVQATDGNFYGTTFAGGGINGGPGTIFKITPSGTLTTLYRFCPQKGCTDGENPYAALVQGTNGTLYGTTESGGANGFGTVFSLSVGLGPFVETNPASGKVGAAVNILGTDLTGATSVTFNGTSAAFTVVSSSEITTTVPTGATTGTVQVVTPGGTLSSNVPFRVLP